MNCITIMNNTGSNHLRNSLVYTALGGEVCTGGKGPLQGHQDTDKLFFRARARVFTHNRQSAKCSHPHQLSLSGFLDSANLLAVT